MRMRWTVGDRTLTWEDGAIDTDSALLYDLVTSVIEQGTPVEPIVNRFVPTGLDTPEKAWSTITVALVDTFGYKGVTIPPSPPGFAQELPDDIIV